MEKPNEHRPSEFLPQDQSTALKCSEEDKDLKHSTTSLAIWENLAVILIAIILFCSGSGLYIIPGLLLFIWGAVSKHESGMSKCEKRKREEDKLINTLSGNRAQKRLRQSEALIGEYPELQNTRQKDSQPSSNDNKRLTAENLGARHENLLESAVILSDSRTASFVSENEGKNKKGEGDGLGNRQEESCEIESEDQDNRQDMNDYADFQPLLMSISLDKLPELASNMRYQHEVGMIQSSDQQTDVQPHDCVVDDKFLCGAYNILWRIEFVDGITWLLRVPSIGIAEKFDELAGNALESEFKIMRFLKTKTTVPVPAVYTYDKSLENPINCPYILMEWIPSFNLYEVWFNESISAAELEKHRTRALKDIAEAMSQLGQFKCDRGGAVLFDAEGRPTGAGTMRIVDEAEYLKFVDEEAWGKVYELGYVVWFCSTHFLANST